MADRDKAISSPYDPIEPIHFGGPADICTPGYSKKVRAVTAKLKRQAYAEYGITSWEPGDYEVDHLIPLSLGGSNSIRNLWPQSYRTSPWNAHVKNVLERRLYNMVCAGKVDLQTAQHEIATDWIKAYQKYIAKSPPSFSLRFEDGSTIRVQLSDPGASVAVRDKNNEVEYLG